MCQKKQDCKPAVAGTVGMCVTGSLLAAVGKYVYGVWEIYFPCHMNILFHGSLTGYAHFHGAPPATPAPGATSSTSLSSDSHGKGGGSAWDFFPCAVPALAMAVPTYHPDFLISLLSITFLCVPEETGLQIRRRRHCGNVCNRFAFGCCGKVCLWGVGNLFSMPHEHTFPWQPNRLCTFPRCSPRDASPRCYK